MSSQDQQAFEELAIFCEFAKVCTLPLNANTAQKRHPPEPDILCQLGSGETMAFELVSCEDVTRDDSRRDKCSTILPKRLKEKMEFENALDRAYRDAVASGSIDQPDRFKFHSVDVYFQAGFPSKNSRNKVAAQVIDVLNQNGSGRHLVKDGVIWSIQCEPYPNPSPIEGPCFHVPSGCGARPYIIERIKEKLTKKYASNHEIHLLAWSTTATRTEFEGLGKDKELANLLQSKGIGPFDRIWVFGYGERSIVFDSKALQNVRIAP